MPRRPPPQHPPMSRLMVLWYGIVVTFILVLTIGLFYSGDGVARGHADASEATTDDTPPPLVGQAAPGE